MWCNLPQYGRTPLHYAAYSGSVDAAGALLQRGADPLLEDIVGGSASSGRDVVQDGDTPVTMAVQGGNADAVSLLRNASLSRSRDSDVSRGSPRAD